MSGLGVESGTMREEARWDDAAVVEDENIAFVQEVGEVAEETVFEDASAAIELEHARSGSFRRRLLGYQFFGEFVIEIGDKHSGHFIEWPLEALSENVPGKSFN
jgi:hypothetical protein